MAAQAMYARGRKVSLLGVFARALWVIIRKFFFELAFLDGSAGIIITYYSAVATYTKYVKLYVLWKTHPLSPSLAKRGGSTPPSRLASGANQTEGEGD